MALTALKGRRIHTSGELPAPGESAPGFRLTDGDLRDVSLHDFAGRRLLLIIVPTLEIEPWASVVLAFNGTAAEFESTDAAFLAVSADLPFAQARIRDRVALDRVETLSTMRDVTFANDYGVLMEDGPLAGLCAPAVVVIDEEGTTLYGELLRDLTAEPDFAAVLSALGGESE